jgi:hypothetical protein
MIHFTCPGCGNSLSAPEGCEGRNSICHKCKQAVTVPEGVTVSAGATAMGKLVSSSTTAPAKPAPAKPGPKGAAAPLAPAKAPAQPHARAVPEALPGRGPVRMLLTAARWFGLALAVLLSLAAIMMPLAVPGAGWVSYVTAGLAIFAGLTAVALSVAARGAMLGSAATTVFLGVAALFFSINFALSADRFMAADDVMAKAKAKEGEVREERTQAEEERKAATKMLKKAEEAPAKAETTLKKSEEAEGRAVVASEKAAALLAQVKAAEAKLDKKRDQLAEHTAALAAERAKIEDAKAKLDEQRRDAEAANKAAAAKLDEQRREAAEFAKKAAADKLGSKELLDKAEQKEKEAAATQKKVMEAIDAVKLKLKAKAPQDRKAAIAALARLRAFVATADYDLCEVIAFDPVPQMRRDALDALEKVQPKLHALAVTLFLPPESIPAIGYIQAIQKLPAFGRAGLPLIAAQINGSNPGTAKIDVSNGGYSLMMAHAEALGRIAADDRAALNLLLTLPQSSLAIQCRNRADGQVPEGTRFVHALVSDQLLALGKEKPETRKTIVPYFILFLQSALEVERLRGAKALAAFGSDAESALPILKKMGMDSSEQVRNAVKEAIAAIEKGNK